MISERLHKSLAGQRVAVLYLNFGPYHLARLRAIARALEPLECALTGIELASFDQRYKWSVSRNTEPFHWITLFEDRPLQSLSKPEQAAAIRKVLDKERPRAVIIAGWSHAYHRAALRWCGRKKATAVLMADSAIDTRESSGGMRARRRWWLEFAKRWLLRGFASAQVAGNASRDYISSLGIPRDRIFLKYDVVDNEYFAQAAEETRSEKSHWQSKLNVPNRFFFYGSRMVEMKNHLTLLDAYERYLRLAGDSAWNLILVGSGQTEQAVDSAIARIGSPKVSRRPLAPIDEIARYYGLASALVFPSLFETWGLIINEAASAGLPILASRNVHGSEHLVADGRNGLLFNPTSPDDIAEKMLAMSSMSSDALAQLGAASRQIISEWDCGAHATELLRALDAGISIKAR